MHLEDLFVKAVTELGRHPLEKDFIAFLKREGWQIGKVDCGNMQEAIYPVGQGLDWEKDQVPILVSGQEFTRLSFDIPIKYA